MKRNTQNIIDSAKEKHNTRYDMYATDIKYIIEKYEGVEFYQRLYDTIVDSYYYGYEMGKRATAKEFKRK